MKQHYKGRPPRAGRKGSVLIAVLGLVALLSVLLVTFLGEAVERIRYNGLLDRSSDLRERAYSGLEIALASMAQTAEIDEGLRSISQGWGSPLDTLGFTPFEDCELSISCEDESARLPLAGLSQEQLSVLFEELGLMSSDADRLAIAFLDWMDPDDNTRINGFDGQDYERAAIPCKPSNAVPRSYEELFLIEGFATHFRNSDGSPSERFATLREAISLQNDAKVNVNNASPFVLRVLAELGGFDEARLMRLLEGGDRQRGNIDDGILTSLDALSPTGDTSLIAYEAQLLRLRVVATRGDARFSLDVLARRNATRSSSTTRNLSTKKLSEQYKDFPQSPESSLRYPFSILQIRENRND